MARIRSIKPEFPQSESMGNVSRLFKKTAITADVRRAVAARYGCEPGKSAAVTCAYCDFTADIHWFASTSGRKNSLGCPSFGHFELDHVISEFKGGATEEVNLVLACLPCNRSKGQKELTDWRASNA